MPSRSLAKTPQPTTSNTASASSNPTCSKPSRTNPPATPSSRTRLTSSTLHPQVRDYEPAQALFAGPTGLEVYQRLIPQARALLQPRGLLALEIGHGQREAVAALLTGWHEVAFLDDLQQIPRVALARHPST